MSNSATHQVPVIRRVLSDKAPSCDNSPAAPGTPPRKAGLASPCSAQPSINARARLAARASLADKLVFSPDKLAGPGSHVRRRLRRSQDDTPVLPFRRSTARPLNYCPSLQLTNSHYSSPRSFPLRRSADFSADHAETAGLALTTPAGAALPDPRLMSIPELRQQLRDAGLPDDGAKAMLVVRLANHMLSRLESLQAGFSLVSLATPFRNAARAAITRPVATLEACSLDASLPDDIQEKNDEAAANQAAADQVAVDQAAADQVAAEEEAAEEAADETLRHDLALAATTPKALSAEASKGSPDSVPVRLVSLVSPSTPQWLYGATPPRAGALAGAVVSWIQDAPAVAAPVAPAGDLEVEGGGAPSPVAQPLTPAWLREAGDHVSRVLSPARLRICVGRSNVLFCPAPAPTPAPAPASRGRRALRVAPLIAAGAVLVPWSAMVGDQPTVHGLANHPAGAAHPVAVTWAVKALNLSDPRALLAGWGAVVPLTTAVLPLVATLVEANEPLGLLEGQAGFASTAVTPHPRADPKTGRLVAELLENATCDAPRATGEVAASPKGRKRLWAGIWAVCLLAASIVVAAAQWLAMSGPAAAMAVVAAADSPAAADVEPRRGVRPGRARSPAAGLTSESTPEAYGSEAAYRVSAASRRGSLLITPVRRSRRTGTAPNSGGKANTITVKAPPGVRLEAA